MSPHHPSGQARGWLGGLRRAGRATGRAARAGGRGVRSVTGAHGADESGLARVLELHLVSTAADTLVVTALATTIFFAAPTDQARDRVALSLLVTMVPFALLAPVLGPLLDRLRSGRRYALAVTMLGRAFCAWVMATAATGGTDETGYGLYPAAFGFLIGQKAYLITRAAAVPRVLPRGVGLVAANARISLAGVAAMALAAPLGVGLNALLGPEWTLRLAFLVFALAGTALAIGLPAEVDSDQGEEPARTDRSAQAAPAGGRGNVGARVVQAVRMNATLRAFAGFLTLFLAFRLRSEPLPQFSADQAVAAILVLAGVGAGVGTALGSRITGLRPERIVLVLPVLVAAAATWAALDYGTPAVLTVAGVAGLAQAMGKLCLDALIQRDVADRVRTSAFARSETVLQLAWVLGGLIGLVLPLSGPWGLAIAAAATAGAGAAAVIQAVRRAGTPPEPRSRPAN